MKIAVYTIALNEKKFVRSWQASASDADYLLIADTGSTDGTVEEAKKLGVNVVSVVVKPWRFDDARNAALAMLPADIDYCIALDMDEVLVPGWREHLESMPSATTRPRYKYVWNWNEDGSEGLVYGGDKIHKRTGYRWIHPVHEVLTCVDQEVQNWIGLQIHHHADQTKSRGQYLPLLKKAVDERPNDDRNTYYYARELFFYGRNEEASAEFKRHLALPNAVWRPERAASMRYLAKIETAETETWLLRAAAEAPEFREPWVDLAFYYYTKQQWENCLSSAKRALSIVEKPLVYLNEANAWGAMPHDLASIAAWELGNLSEGLSHAQKALSLSPNDERIQENVAMMLRRVYPEKITAVIPTRSNVEGALEVIKKLQNDQQVLEIVVVADGPKAHKTYSNLLKNSEKVTLKQVPLGVGIHVMWNIGIDISIKNQTSTAFINDDIVLGDNCIGTLASLVEHDKGIGVVCPNYDYRKFAGMYQDVDTTANGRSDGSGGLAGYCMVIPKTLTTEWKFDERMKWWYGDDDVLYWVLRTKKLRAVVASVARCSGNYSATVDNDPPPRFVDDVLNDKLLFRMKWD
jgi:glycosyltransferase involved in cell wall biosynthesis